MAGNKNSIAWLFYPAVSLAVFFPCLALGKAYFHDDLLMQYFPFRDFLRSQIAGGHFPLWNPYLLGGIPFWADPNAMAAYPLQYVTLLFPTAYGLGVFYFLHLSIAFLGMRFFLRAFSFSEESCRVGAVTFGLSGFFGWEIVHPPLLAAFSWLPWFFGFLERLLQDPKPKTAFFAGLSYALLFLSGNYQMSVTVFYGGVLYLAARWATEKKLRKVRVSRAATGALMGGIFPLFLWLVPSLEFILHSSRFGSAKDYLSFNADFSLEPGQLLQFLFPANPMGPSFAPYPAYLDNMGYLGIWAPFLILTGLKGSSAGRRALGAVGVFGLLLAFGKYLPFHHWACDGLPGIGFLRSPFRFLCLYAFAGAFFTARGYESFRATLKARGKGSWRGWIFLYAGLLAALVILKFPDHAFQLPFLGMGLLACLWIDARKGPHPWSLGLLEAAFLFPMLAAFWHVASPGPSSNFDYAAQMPFLADLPKASAQGRVLVPEDIPYGVQCGPHTYWAKSPVDAACLFGVRTVDGYNPLIPGNFSRSWTLPAGTFGKLWALQGWLTGPRQAPPEGELQNSWGAVRFYRSPDPRPFCWVAEKTDVLPDEEAVWTTMQSADFDPYQRTLLTGSVDGSLLPSSGVFQSAGDWIPKGPNEEGFQLQLPRQALVVFSETVFPGWKAWIDGQPARIYTADGLLRALEVPAGAHDVKFCYRPWWLWPSLALGFLWLISLGAWRLFRPGRW